MKNRDRISRRIRTARAILAMCLCLVMMPFGVYADDLPEGTTGQETGSTTGQEQPEQNEGTITDGASDQDAASGQEGQTGSGDQASGNEEAAPAEETPAAEEPAEEEPVPSRKAKSFKWSGINVKVNSDVLIDDPLGFRSRPYRICVTGQKSSIKVTWSKAADLDSIDGYILLKKSGGTYYEAGRFGKSVTSYTDKKAKKKNTGYYYTVVGYKKTAEGLRISGCTPWAGGVTTKSKLKNGYSAKISKTKATVQAGDTFTLSLKYASPKKTFQATSFRWLTNNASVATVSGKGTVTAAAEGTARIRGRLASGRDMECVVTVVGAYKSGKPVPDVDYATEDSIWLSWNKTTHATSYDVYRSDDGGDTFNDPVNVTGTEFTDTGLTAEHEYTYYVVARNDNRGYTSLSDESERIVQKAVKTPRKTKMHGLPAKASQKAGTKRSIKFTVVAPEGRTADLQLLSGGTWKTVASVTLPAGAAEASSSIAYPDTWWKESSTSWRISIPACEDATAYVSPVMALTTARYYQNPKGYVQITNKISKHGYNYYTAPVLVNNLSTKSDHIEAMIKTAYKYKGDKYANRWSRAPGKGVDCSGLVMQACYGAGVDLWPSNPHRHRYGAAKYEWESREIAKNSKLKTVAYKNRKRGDLIFFCNSKGTIIHVAIYLGNNKIIHSTTVGGRVKVSGMGGGAYGRPCKVKRIFN